MMTVLFHLLQRMCKSETVLAISLNFLLYVLKLLQLLFPMINIGYYFLSLRFFFNLSVYQGRMADVVCDTEIVLHDWEIRNIPRATTMTIKSVCAMIHTTVTHLRYRWACLQTCCQTKRTLNDMLLIQVQWTSVECFKWLPLVIWHAFISENEEEIIIDYYSIQR